MRMGRSRMGCDDEKKVQTPQRQRLGGPIWRRRCGDELDEAGPSMRPASH